MGACTESGKMAIVCELMKESVYDILRKHKDISLIQRVKMAKDTAAGVAWLHGAVRFFKSLTFVDFLLEPTNYSQRFETSKFIGR